MFDQYSQTELSEADKSKIRELLNANVSKDVIASYFGITEGEVNELGQNDDITLEEIAGIEGIAPIEVGSTKPKKKETKIFEVGSASYQTYLPKLSTILEREEPEEEPEQEAEEVKPVPIKKAIASFAEASFNALVECGSVEKENSEIRKLEDLAAPLREKARLTKTQDPRASKSTPLWSYLPPKESIALRRLEYQIDELDKKRTPVLDCQTEEVEKELEQQGLKVVRTKKGTGTLILKDF